MPTLHKSKGKIVVVCIIVVVFLALAATVGFLSTRDDNAITTVGEPTDSRTKEEKQAQLERDTGASPDDAENSSPAPLDNPVTAERPALEVAIASLSQDQNTVQFKINTIAKPSTGDCILRLERQGFNRIEKSIPLTHRSCESEFLELPAGAGGEWVATVMIMSEGVVASDTRTVSIK